MPRFEDVPRMRARPGLTQAFFDTVEGKTAISKALTAFLRWDIPKNCIQACVNSRQDYRPRLYGKRIWVRAQEFFEWHHAADIRPTKDQVYAAAIASRCSNGKPRFIVQWAPEGGRYDDDGTYKWEVCITDADYAPNVTHEAYDRIYAWIRAPQPTCLFEDLPRDYQPIDVGPSAGMYDRQPPPIGAVRAPEPPAGWNDPHHPDRHAARNDPPVPGPPHQHNWMGWQQAPVNAVQNAAQLPVNPEIPASECVDQ